MNAFFSSAIMTSPSLFYVRLMLTVKTQAFLSLESTDFLLSAKGVCDPKIVATGRVRGMKLFFYSIK